MRKRRGEVVTLIAVGAVALIGVVSLISSFFVNNSATVRSKAAEANVCDASSKTSFSCVGRAANECVCDGLSAHKAYQGIDNAYGKYLVCCPDGAWHATATKQTNCPADPTCANGTTATASATTAAASGTCPGIKTGYTNCSAVTAAGKCVYRTYAAVDPHYFNQWIYCCADGSWYAKDANNQDPTKGWQNETDCVQAGAVAPTAATTAATTTTTVADTTTAAATTVATAAAAVVADITPTETPSPTTCEDQGVGMCRETYHNNFSSFSKPISCSSTSPGYVCIESRLCCSPAVQAQDCHIETYGNTDHFCVGNCTAQRGDTPPGGTYKPTWDNKCAYVPPDLPTVFGTITFNGPIDWMDKRKIVEIFDGRCPGAITDIAANCSKLVLAKIDSSSVMNGALWSFKLPTDVTSLFAVLWPSENINSDRNYSDAIKSTTVTSVKGVSRYTLEFSVESITKSYSISGTAHLPDLKKGNLTELTAVFKNGDKTIKSILLDVSGNFLLSDAYTATNMPQSGSSCSVVIQDKKLSNVGSQNVDCYKADKVNISANYGTAYCKWEDGTTVDLGESKCIAVQDSKTKAWQYEQFNCPAGYPATSSTAPYCGQNEICDDAKKVCKKTCGLMGLEVCKSGQNCSVGTAWFDATQNKRICTEDCYPKHGVCTVPAISQTGEELSYRCGGLNKCYDAATFFRVALAEAHYYCNGQTGHDCLTDIANGNAICDQRVCGGKDHAAKCHSCAFDPTIPDFGMICWDCSPGEEGT